MGSSPTKVGSFKVECFRVDTGPVSDFHDRVGRLALVFLSLCMIPNYSAVCDIEILTCQT